MPPKNAQNDLCDALESAGFSFSDATRIGIRTSMLPKVHRSAIRDNIIARCKAKTLRPDSVDGRKLIDISNRILQ